MNVIFNALMSNLLVCRNIESIHVNPRHYLNIDKNNSKQ